MFLFASYHSTFLGNVGKNSKSHESFRALASKCLNPVFQCANCLILDAYFGGKVKFIWSEKNLSKGQNFEEKISSLSSILWSSSYDLS